MPSEHHTAIAPEQHHGASSETTRCRTLKDRHSAEAHYQVCSKRLMDPGSWKTHAGGGAAFLLTDENARPVSGKPAQGMFVRIDIPGLPDTASGKGYEWVRITEVTERNDAERWLSRITVRPADSPVPGTSGVAHFFTPQASSTFAIVLEGTKVCAMVLGRNERPNTNAPGLFSRIRNFFVGILAMIGLNKPQWLSLVKGLVR